MNNCWGETGISPLEDRNLTTWGQELWLHANRNWETAKSLGTETSAPLPLSEATVSPLSFSLCTCSPTSSLPAGAFFVFPMHRRQLPSSFWLVHLGSDVPLSQTRDRNKTLLTTFYSLTFQLHEPRAACMWLWVTEAIQTTLSIEWGVAGERRGYLLAPVKEGRLHPWFVLSDSPTAGAPRAVT